MLTKDKERRSGRPLCTSIALLNSNTYHAIYYYVDTKEQRYFLYTSNSVSKVSAL